MKVGGLFRHQVRCLKIGNNVGTARRAASHHTVVFLRHGESIWNLENRYTGWCDVPLTRNGELEAEDTGQLMRERGLIFDVAFTSNLQRAWKTCEIALKHAGMGHIPQIRSWKLNERYVRLYSNLSEADKWYVRRHYGLLQGHTKDCEYLTRLFGEEQILRWRRSYTDTPPSLNDPLLRKKVNQLTLQDSEKYLLPQYDPTRMLQEDSLKHLELPSIDHCPSAESLKTCETRAYGYWKSVRLSTSIIASSTIYSHGFLFRLLKERLNLESEFLLLLTPIQSDLWSRLLTRFLRMKFNTCVFLMAYLWCMSSTVTCSP